MSTLFLSIGFIFVVMIGGIVIERLYRRFATRHPQLGPFRDTTKCGSCAAKQACERRSASCQG
jgi:hypothetical protein